MQSSEKTPEAYIHSLPEKRQKILQELRQVLQKNLPDGFEETMQYGMISYVVPHTLYPAGYHCNPSDALPFISIASQKNYISLYHMGLYADEEILKWFQEEYTKTGKKLNMGKSCIRWKENDPLPYDILGQLATKISPRKWIQTYESKIR